MPRTDWNDQSSTVRGLAVAVAGLAAGILGSRLLPPLVAMVTGAARSRRTHDPFDLLVSDHRTIMRLLDQMMGTPKDATSRRASSFLLLKRKLARHAMAEEDVVYPILHDRANDAHESIELYDDHAHIKIMLFEIEQRLMAGQDWTDVVGTLRDLTREHIIEEENKIFPRLRQMLNQSEGATVSGQISREQALVL